MDQEIPDHRLKAQVKGFQVCIQFQRQVDGYEIFFVIVKMVRPDTRAGCSDIKSKLENMKM